MATAHPVRVEVATPGGAVLVDAHVATETVAAVRACLDDPARTWLAPGTRLGPTAPEVAARYDDLLSAWAGELA